MLRNELYRPFFTPTEDWGFEIIDGVYSDTVVQIAKLEMDQESSNGVSIEYHVLKRPDQVSEEDVQGESFNAVLEIIINDILTEALQTLKEDNEQT